MANFRWLHCSDLHFCPTVDFDTNMARRQLLLALKGQKCDYLFITGDIANQNNYVGAKDFLDQLIDTIGIENKSRVFWAAGNHDISRNDSIRKTIINEIRGDANPRKQFENAMQDAAKRRFLTQADMSSYYDQYTSIFGKNFTETERTASHFYAKGLPDLNLIILNTCITSCDNSDPSNLYIVENSINDAFKCIDRQKPTFVLGHHSSEYFSLPEREAIGYLFDDNSVDFYLCGHSHRLGYSSFSDAARDIHQFTSGGGIFDGYSTFSCMLGEYDDIQKAVHITPYQYDPFGNHQWNECYTLHRRLGKSNFFQIERLLPRNPIILQTEQIPQSGFCSSDDSMSVDHSTPISRILLHLQDRINVLSPSEKNLLHKKIDELLPKWPQRSSEIGNGRLPSLPEVFIDYSDFVAHIENMVDQNFKLLLSGIPGSGKTTYIAAFIRSKMHEHYPYIWFQWNCQNTYEDFIEALANTLGIGRSRAFSVPLEISIGRYLAGTENAVLFVDGIPESASWDILKFLREVNCKVILTSRAYSFEGFAKLEVPSLSLDSCKELFCFYSQADITDPVLPDIIRSVGEHPFTLMMLAKYQKRFHCTSQQLLTMIIENDLFLPEDHKLPLEHLDGIIISSTAEHLYKLFHTLNDISDLENIALHVSCLCPNVHISIPVLLFLLDWNDDRISVFDDLAKRGYITIDSDNQEMAIHPIIGSLIRNNYSISVDAISFLFDRLTHYCNAVVALEQYISDTDTYCIHLVDNIILRFGSDNSSILKLRCSRVGVMEKYAFYQRAISECDELLAYSLINEQADVLLFLHMSRISCLVEYGDYSSAEKYLHHLDISEAGLDANSTYAVTILEAGIHIGLEQYTEALAILEALSPVVSEQQRAGFLEQCATVYHYLENNKKAVDLNKQAIALLKKDGKENTVLAGVIYTALSAALAGMLKNKAAIYYAKIAIKIFEENISENHNHIITAYGNLANAYLQENEFEKARKLYEKVICLAENSFSMNMRFLYNAYAGYACCLMHAHMIDEGLASWERAVNCACANGHYGAAYIQLALSFGFALADADRFHSLQLHLNELQPHITRENTTGSSRGISETLYLRLCFIAVVGKYMCPEWKDFDGTHIVADKEKFNWLALKKHILDGMLDNGSDEEAEPDDNSSPLKATDIKEIAVYGPAAAGSQLNAEGDPLFFMLMDSSVPSNADYGIKITGMSMMPIINDGDIAWVKKQNSLENKDIGIFCVDDGNYVCKQLIKGAPDTLHSFNPIFEDIAPQEYEDWTIVGKVLHIHQSTASHASLDKLA